MAGLVMIHFTVLTLFFPDYAFSGRRVTLYAGKDRIYAVAVRDLDVNFERKKCKGKYIHDTAEASLAGTFHYGRIISDFFLCL